MNGFNIEGLKTAVEGFYRKIGPEKANRNAISMDAFLGAADGLYGNLTAIARRLGVPRTALCEFLKNSLNARSVIESQRGEFDDLVESLIQQKILDGDKSLLRFYAVTRLRNRGFGTGKDAVATAKPPDFNVNLNLNNEKTKDALPLE